MEKPSTKIIPKDNYFIIERDEFYILRSKEAIKIKIAEIAGAEGIKKIPKWNIFFGIIEIFKFIIK